MKKNMFYSIILISTIGLLVSCGKSIGCMNLSCNTDGQITVDLREGDQIQVWNSIDIEYLEGFTLSYLIEITDGANTIVNKKIDGFTPDIKMLSSETVFGNKHHITWKNGRIDSGIVISEDGKYTIKIETLYKGNMAYTKKNLIELKLVSKKNK